MNKLAENESSFYYRFLKWVAFYFFIAVIIDASESCNVAGFNIGSGTNARQWDIKGEHSKNKKKIITEKHEK